jgi:hypothetical protein
MAHKVRHHEWHNGILSTIDHLFDSLDDALEFSKTVDSDHVKVYDESGQLVQATQNQPASTYA